MWKIFGAVLIVAGFAGSAQAQKVGGDYTVKGTNFDGSAYEGTATITPSGSACRMVWNTGGSVTKGICMLANKAFAASYNLQGEIGLVVYEVQPDGSMKGFWTIADKDGSGTETLTPAK
jgi:hypothetical protein